MGGEPSLKLRGGRWINILLREDRRVGGTVFEFGGPTESFSISEKGKEEYIGRGGGGERVGKRIWLGGGNKGGSKISLEGGGGELVAEGKSWKVVKGYWGGEGFPTS